MAAFFGGELVGRKRESIKFEAEREQMRFKWRLYSQALKQSREFQERLTPEFLEKVRRYDDAQRQKKWAFDPERFERKP